MNNKDVLESNNYNELIIAVERNNGYVYRLYIYDGNYEETFRLSMDENIKAINDSLTIKLVDDDNYNFYSI